MSLTGKPLWLEGMFLRPQHLQQYDRWIESNLEQRVSSLLAYAWGLRSLLIDPEGLKNGQIQISAADLVFPDGTIYAAPAAQPLPKARRILPDGQGKRVYLALPMKAAGGIEVAEGASADQRFSKTTADVRNNAQSDRPPAGIFVGTRMVICSFTPSYSLASLVDVATSRRSASPWSSSPLPTAGSVPSFSATTSTVTRNIALD